MVRPASKSQIRSHIIPLRIYDKLYSSTYLKRKRVRIPHFTDLVDFLAEEELGEDSIEVFSLDEELLWNLKDLTEKLGSVYLSKDLLFEPRESKGIGIYQKYYFYNTIVYTKACLDTIAVTINNFFKLGFVGGQIDFRKGSFVRVVETSFVKFKSFSQIYGYWLHWIFMFRDALVHQKSIEIFNVKRGKRWVMMIPLHPLSMMERWKLKENVHNSNVVRTKLGLISLSHVMRKIIENLKSIVSKLSEVILDELRRQFPNHTPSSKTYY